MPARAEPVHVEVALPSCGAPPPSPVSGTAALAAILADPQRAVPPPPPPPPNVRKMLSHAATLRGLDRAAAFRDVLEHAPAHGRELFAPLLAMGFGGLEGPGEGIASHLTNI